jgi:hypothetical protein
MRRDLLTSAPEAFWRVFRVSVGFGNQSTFTNATLSGERVGKKVARFYSCSCG